MSGDAIAFLDPHEIHFGRSETGRQFSLGDQPLRQCRDQFLPYEDVLDCKISTQFYNGTLFRFPLRGEPSDLSNKNYTAEKVRQLFHALQKEASVILLFLKNIEEIALFEADESNTRRHVFTVRLSDSCGQDIRVKKRSLLMQVKKLSEERVTYTQLSLTFTVEELSEKGSVVNHKWFVYHQIDARDSKLKQLSSELGLLPWVGFATPLNGPERQALSSSGGRIFCFLPLPPDDDAKTGFPVHVHGYFGLTDNRRGLKWPGLDCQNDLTAEWNVLLSERVGSPAYASMLLELVEQIMQESGSSSAKADLVYLSWPTIQTVQKHWKDMLRPMFSILMTRNVFWTPADGGKWIAPKDAYLDRMTDSSEIKQVVLETLTQANEAVVTLPSHVLDAIDFMTCYTHTITPAYLRNLLKKKQKGSWNIASTPKMKRLKLLEYVLQDKNLNDMQGVPLLPLANGNFVEFRSLQYNREPSAAVYVPSPTHSRSLFYNMESRFLDDSVHSPALHYLSQVAADTNFQTSHSVQLVRINQTIAVKLVRQILPKEWSGANHLVFWYPGQNGHPHESWLENVWKWIQSDFPKDLSPLEDLPLIPHSTSGNRTIVKLRASSLAIRQHQGLSLPSYIVSLLKKLGCVVVESLPSYVNHVALHNYIASPDPYGVLKVLQVLGQDKCASMISVLCTTDEKEALREFLSSTSFNTQQKCLIQSLPIFDAADRTSFLSVKEGSHYRTIAPYGFELPECLPIPNASSIISLRDLQSCTLIGRLDLSMISPTTFLTSYVFIGINSGFYSYHQISTLMCWVLRQYNYMQDGAFRESLKQLRFALTQSNRLVTPCELLNPQEQILQRLFEGDSDRFPHGDYAKDDILQTLRKLGMRSDPNTQDILHVAQTLQNFAGDTASRKASALLEFLDQNPSLLLSDGTLVQGLNKERWVQRKENRPASYPRVMPWFQGKERFFKPQELTSPSKANLVGATMPLVSKACCKALETAFGWNKSPSPTHLLEQLRFACCASLNAMDGYEKHPFERMLKDIYQEVSKNADTTIKTIANDSGFPAWIWHGSGFTSPTRIAFSISCKFNLKPYLYEVPEDLHSLRSFFERCGVRPTFSDSDLLDILAKIKEKHDTTGARNEGVIEDQKLSCDILHWIVRDGKPLSSDLRTKLLVPVMTWDNTLKLVPCSECTFCDVTWLMKGGPELPVTSQYPMILDKISTSVAELLGVPPISTLVTCAEALGIEQTGPYEPITTRLKNILSEYKEGVGVFRELVQNADDAGATEVKFVLDWRNHPKKSLLASGMADCQGPALLVYNNAVFTDDDLKNISKLAGATKKEDLEKIGRFGLGFSSVYHFTDVPSFISRCYALFFDPHRTHLEKQIRDAAKPGIKLDLAVNPANLQCFSHQFVPFNGFFGCDTSSSTGPNKFHFQGTLFRFPFRTKGGEISEKVYSQEEIRRLVFSFQDSSSSLLLFTQNVRKVSFLEVDKNSIDPGTHRVLFEIEKESANVYEQNKKSEKELSFLMSCATWTRQVAGMNRNLNQTSPPKRSELVTISSKINSNGAKKSQETCCWLVTSCLGTGNSFQVATSEEGKKQGLLSASGIAGRISSSINDEDFFLPEVSGEVFCFLPLSIPTGLPVHVNGYFAVTSNRRGIWESTTAEVWSHQPIEARWNKSLMEDALSQAYLLLLQDMMLMQKKGKVSSYGTFALWPNPDTLKSSSWTTLITSVYQGIAKSDLPLVHMGDKWLPVTQCMFQDAKLQKLPNSANVLAMLGYKVVQLPNFVKKGFEQAGCMQIIKERTMTQEKFLEEVFFPNIIKIPGHLRDVIVCYLIDHCLLGHSQPQPDSLRSLYTSLLSKNPCIPCGSGDEDLAFPKDLISPNSKAASLFTSEDKRFPVGKCYRTRERLLMLEDLGMLSDIIDWGTLLERAQTVPVIYLQKSEQDALKRVHCLVNYLNEHLLKLGTPTEAQKVELTRIDIFPVLKKPANYVMPWKGCGDHRNSVNMLSAEKLYSEEYMFVVGSSWPILDESEILGCGKLNPETRSLFGFNVRKPTFHEVLVQLDQAIQITANSPAEAQCLEDVSQSIYGYLQELLLTSDGETIIEELSDRCWILIQGSFLSSSQLAFSWKRTAEPYLYEVPKNLADKYRHLLQATGVRQNFDTEDVVRTLYKLSREKRGKPLSKTEFRVTRSLIEELLEAPGHALQAENGMIPLPDHNMVLYPAKELAINDAPWVTSKYGTSYVHEYVPIDLAYKIGAIDIRSKKLAEISRPIGQPFGQREELTDRLKGILKSYPCDVGILKELVQNADDAGASEIHFIYDPRNHPTERLLSENWKELQGPALCVYNDKPFSERDLEGIQRLGIGSKTEDPTKTGQYGIGFNAVYHLTDCPSFISNRDTICILDPHCRYAPGATKENPGRLIGPITQEERTDYRDVFPCYLEDHFNLTSATMFRFPLRNTQISLESLISEEQVSPQQMASFMNMFTVEAKEMLLFLNHLKKITLSQIEEGKVKQIYSVSAQLKDEDAIQRVHLSDHIKKSKAVRTNDIEWVGITYPLLVEETVRHEKWLIHQCVGLKPSDKDEEVPDGRHYGLLPRGGIAAKISEKYKSQSSSSCARKGPQHKAFCFLPLPLETGLPVHVNGHFYLDSARRNLWHDENDEGFGSKWNQFMKSRVLAQAYVSLMLVARRFLPGLKGDADCYFSKEYLLHEGMRWYHDLFPYLKSVKDEWALLAASVFQKICSQDEKLLPMVKQSASVALGKCQTGSEAICSQEDKLTLMVKKSASEGLVKCQTVSEAICSRDNMLPPTVKKSASGALGKCQTEGKAICSQDDMLPPTVINSASEALEKCQSIPKAICSQDETFLPMVKTSVSEAPVKYRTESQASGKISGKGLTRCLWLSPSEGFFNTMTTTSAFDEKRRDILLQIGFKLLYSANRLFEDFKKAGTSVKQITPQVVIQSLKHGPTHIAKLPCPVNQTALGSAVGVLCILSYCMKAPKFAEEMFGLPLLLTEDEVLRCFEEDDPVFLSRFSDVVSKKRHMFIHHTLATSLLDIEKEIFATDQQVLMKFDIPALATLLPSIDSGTWRQTDNLIGWDNKDPSENWLQRLWEFIFKTYQKDPKSFSLDPLGKWPVIPTQSGMLSPVSKGKVVLDLTTSEDWSSGQRHVVKLLQKLNCHEVDAPFISSSGRWDTLRILKPYLSQPNSSQDVLKVLDHLMKTKDLSGSLSENEVISILQFFQEDTDSLIRDPTSSSTLKRLPFFKTFHGNFVRLENVSSIYVVPIGLPTEESDIWMTGNNCVFLAREPRLDRLYRELLGAGDTTHTDCYINFIFPKFPDLKQSTRMLHLEYVRRHLMLVYVKDNQRCRIINSLKTLAFIPDASGRPRVASHFYDPGVKVFSVMLPPESKPPKPFDEVSGWLNLLREIGLKQEVSKDLFITFANTVATQAAHASKSNRSGLEKKSKALVKHLLTATSLHDKKYLCEISAVKFVASQMATDELIHLHKQHLVTSQEQLPPFTEFKGSVPHTHERLTWTTASLLPHWAVPDPNCSTLATLQVLHKPSLGQVIDNVINLSKNASKRADREQPEPRRRLLTQIMTEVYTFLTKLSGCTSGDSLESCSETCQTIERRLSSIPCILVENGRVFVRCDQLAYELEEELPPYLYKVPREYGAFEHLFKRLGAMEKATPVQYAKLLSRLKEACGNETMHANEVTAAKRAVYGLFVTLHALHGRKGDVKKTCLQENPLAACQILYLPSRSQRLQCSTSLVLFDSPQYRRRLQDTMYEFLDGLEKYDLTFLILTPAQLVDLLPTHLQPKRLSTLVREDLHQDCKNKRCQADIESKCQATEQIRQVVFSPQLVSGILRILKFQFQKAKLTEEVCNNVRSFQSELGMSCMEVLSTVLVENETNTPIPDSQRNKWTGCFVGEENGRKHIFIKHGAEISEIHKVLCREINQLTGCYIDKDSWLHLFSILACSSPRDIALILDNAGVTEDMEASDTPQLEPELGSDFPEELHYLLVQYDDFYFRPEEFVAFEREDSTDEEPRYIYAKILYRIKTSQPAKQRKDRIKKEQKGESNLLSRYMIDVGHEKKEVDVLDLYKIRRPQQNVQEEDAAANEPVSESTALVPYKGAAGESERTKAGPSTSSQGSAEPPKPRKLEEALKEVQEALSEIWKLPEDKRKKALKRLYLRWHPDKNMDMQHIANEVMKFIQNEVEKLSIGGSVGREDNFERNHPDFSDSFRHWHQRARQQRSSYENFRRHNPRFTGFASSSRRRYAAPNAHLSRIWISQSRDDLRSVKHLLASRDPLFYLVCFQCHQVAEKALKATLYALSGVADSQLCSHDLVKLAYDLSLLPGAPDVTPLVAPLSTYYDTTRYPYKHVPARAPSEAFQDSQEAQRALKAATDVLTTLEQCLGL